jgi:stage IV sporulation protein FB
LEENFSYKPDEPALQNIYGENSDQLIFPPKPSDEKPASNVWVKSIISLGLYIVLGYYVFKSFNILLLITAVVIIHEMGHFLAMKAFRYKDLGIFFIPLLGAYVSGSKREVSQLQSAIILLAGPLPGIIIGIIFYFFAEQNPFLDFAGISYYTIANLFVFLNLLNLFPVYPLDGGQLLNRVFLDEEKWVSKLFVFLSAAFMLWVAWQSKFWVLAIFPAMMLLRLRTDKQMDKVEKKMEEAGIDLNCDYEHLKDEDYWKARNILVANHSTFKNIPPAPPYEYDRDEEKIMTSIQNLLHRHLIQDLSIVGKIIVLVIWVAAIAAPFILGIESAMLRQFGF